MTRKCVGCDETFAVSDNERRPRRWCGQACRHRSMTDARLGADWRSPRTCVHCGSSFQPRLAKSLYCSRRCGWLARAAARPKSEDWAAGTRPLRVATCPHCGTTALKRATRWTCDDCRRTLDAQRGPHKAAVRRAAIAAASVRVRASDIFTRDGNRCYLCGFAGAPKSTQHDPWRLTLDHVVPVSRGGSHEPDNLRTAHRKCNMRKGDRSVAARTYHDDVLWEVGGVRP